MEPALERNSVSKGQYHLPKLYFKEIPSLPMVARAGGEKGGSQKDKENHQNNGESFRGEDWRLAATGRYHHKFTDEDDLSSQNR